MNSILWIRAHGAPSQMTVNALTPYGMVVPVLVPPIAISGVSTQLRRLRSDLSHRRSHTVLIIADSTGYDGEAFQHLLGKIEEMELPILALLEDQRGHKIENDPLDERPSGINLSRLARPSEVVLVVRLLLRGAFALTLAEYRRLCRELHAQPVDLPPAKFRGGQNPTPTTADEGVKEVSTDVVINGLEIKLDPYSTRLLGRIMAEPWKLGVKELLHDPLTRETVTPKQLNQAIKVIRTEIRKQGFIGYDIEWHATNEHPSGGYGLVFFFFKP